MEKRRPPTKTIKRVVEWLESQGLSIYGPNVNLEHGFQYPSCRDYDFEAIMKLAALNKRYPDGIPKSDSEDS